MVLSDVKMRYNVGRIIKSMWRKEYIIGPIENIVK